MRVQSGLITSSRHQRESCRCHYGRRKGEESLACSGSSQTGALSAAAGSSMCGSRLASLPPIFVSIASRENRDAVLDKTLKQSTHEAFKKIDIKKDETDRVEWTRLSDAEKTIKVSRGNFGGHIVLDFREQLKNGRVIDRWSFQGL